MTLYGCNVQTYYSLAHDIKRNQCLIDELMQVALQCPIAAGRVRIELTTRLYGEVRCLLDRLDGKVPRHLNHDTSLAADPRDDGGPILVVMAPAGLAFLAATTRLAIQRLLPTHFDLPLVAGGMLSRHERQGDM